MGGVRGRPRKVAEPEAVDERMAKAGEWLAFFYAVRTAHPNADVWAQIAATDWALRND